jgi:hypothetical protein
MKLKNALPAVAVLAAAAVAAAAGNPSVVTLRRTR